MRQWVTVLGATGSIGISTLDVIARHPDRYQVYALTANTRVEALADLCRIHLPRYAVVGSEVAAERLLALLPGQDISVLVGESGCCEVAAAADVDAVMAAIVGAAGLNPTLAAARAGKKVLLANKESLVMAGGLFMDAIRDSGATLLPIDSEHNAIFQCLPPAPRGSLESAGVRGILLTASGGPLRQFTPSQMKAVSPAQAVAHPNWSMGQKISVDSATLMNKGLELIEACWLFDVDDSNVEVVVHPQSVIHSMVEYIDGSVLAQLGNPDMRTPIAYGLAWPERIDAGVSRLDIIATARLDFESPDEKKFPCLPLARQAWAAGGTASAVLNAANEIAVAEFLAGRLPFMGIPAVIEEVLVAATIEEPIDLAVIQAADGWARQQAARAALAYSVRFQAS
ncbi:MAG: 1-deoxy-D-xylulose-5-phosphate reductoisomerase [Pseudomonadales bacterium]